MANQYEPTVSEAVFPSDGGWTMDGDKHVLLLSIPEFSEVINHSFESYRYAWLYDKENDAYIFCFQFDDGFERAVLFQREHAGILLTEAAAYEMFTIVISDQAFDKIDEQTVLLELPQIKITRMMSAGW
ncbi:hypothetical protein [Desertibacillus haloalkaliphilus]|uniref:hypothetical protein n=1 Tax=Desertibacillus haloalkaliphilus TaxID=1328930 RepID=UPI001C252A1C|nr:hypothetical protein [Desertibacillus haloalkaliphilus]MBU8905276.1 hypothetical protein [Desertibacillus haloalkaliphilus]